MTLVLPFVNRGSGSFLKKDFNKLLMTLRSRHFCRVDQGSFRLMQFLQYESITVQRCCQGSGALYCATWLSVTHVFLDVDVIHAFAVELLLHAGDGSVVPRDPVDSCVLQTSLLHNLAAHLHDERNILHKLHKKTKKKINIMNHIGQWHHTLLAPVNEWFKVDVKMHFICLEETHFIFIWMIMSPSLKKQNKKTCRNTADPPRYFVQMDNHQVGHQKWCQLESFSQMASLWSLEWQFSKYLCPVVDWTHLTGQTYTNWGYMHSNDT